GGDDGDGNQLNAYADRMERGEYTQTIQTPWGPMQGTLSGSSATLAAAESLTAARLNRQYELNTLQRQAQEMQLAKQQADAETAAANARVAAAKAAKSVAQLKAQGAQQTLNTFDNQTFTADVWQRMGHNVYRLYRRYLSMALKTAKLMQQAYNFETDQALSLIRSDYSSDEVKGL